MFAIIALGANLENPKLQVEQAIECLAKLPKVELLQRSSLYRTKPVGYSEQDDFINAVVSIDTSLSAEQLLDNLHNIEQDFGRKRLFKNGPRTLDLDIIAYGDSVSDDPNLTLPHPRAQERAFVLVPLSEIEPNFVFIDTKRSVSELIKSLAELDDVVRLNS